MHFIFYSLNRKEQNGFDVIPWSFLHLFVACKTNINVCHVNIFNESKFKNSLQKKTTAKQKVFVRLCVTKEKVLISFAFIGTTKTQYKERVFGNL